MTPLKRYKIIVVAFGIALAGLFIKSFDNYGGDDNFLVLGVSVGILIALLLLLVMAKFQISEAKKLTDPFLWSLIVFPLFILYLLIFVNRFFDTSEPTIRSVKVVEMKEVSTIDKGRRRTSYIIDVTSWKTEQVNERIYIREDQFNSLNKGDNVYLKIKKGYLGKAYLYGPPDRIIELQ